MVKWLRYPDSNNQWVDWDQFTANEALADYKCQHPNTVSHIRGIIHTQTLTQPPCPFMSSPSLLPSTIEDVVSPTSATTLQELTIAAPLSALDLETVLMQFPDPTHRPEEEELVHPPLTITSGLVIKTPVVTWAATPPSLYS